ncbi:acyltransferase 3 domain protein [Burkholderia pseudomallei]|nr:acyltransferase 3 domain protein [Burkholderia pseudomallei]
MPQVERIRNAADEAQRRLLERRAHRARPRAPVQQAEQPERAGNGYERARERIKRRLRRDEAGQHGNRRRPHARFDPESRRRPARRAARARDALIQQHARREFPEAPEDQIERLRVHRGARPDAPRERRAQPRREQRGRRVSALAARPPCMEQQRKQQIELLFDAERPRVRIRIEFGLR